MVDLLANAHSRPTKMRFQDLADVHSRRYTQRVQHDIDRLAIFKEWHIFDRHDRRNNTLVTVTASHLVTRLQATLDAR